MRGAQMQTLRKALGETTAVFGNRLGKSARTIEDYEQERYAPSRSVELLLAQIRPPAVADSRRRPRRKSKESARSAP